MNKHLLKLFSLVGISFFMICQQGIALAGSAYAPLNDTTVSGTVTSVADGETLPGVTVLVKGTAIGTVTGIDGKYSLNVPDENDILIFSSVGYLTKEVRINDRSVIDLTLSEDIHSLGEVVVVGYGEQKKETLTGSVSSLKGADISEMSVGNITSALAGQIPGLKVMNRSGKPGGDGAALNIRGFGAPLVLVDGLPQDFGNIDPNEIESISVLKDASATVYGSRAGNGVILVTTKRGSAGKPIFNFNHSSSFSTPTQIEKLADASLYAQLVNEADMTNGSALTFTQEEIEKFRTGNDPQYPNTDWWDETFKTWAPMRDYNFNIRGGREEVNYFLSMGYKDQGSMLKSDDINFDRFSFRSNIDAKISKNFKVGVDISGRMETRERPGRDMPVIMEAVQAAKPTKPAYLPDPTKPSYPGFDTRWANPIPISDRDFSGYNDDNFQTIRGTLTLNYDFSDLISGLSAEGKFDYRRNDIFVKDWRTAFDYHEYDYDNDTYTVVGDFNSGKISLNESYSKDWIGYGYLKMNYDKLFQNKHHVYGMGLVEAQSSRTDFFNGYREGFLTSAIDQMFAGSDENKDSNGGANEAGRMAYVGKVGYDYLSKYIVDFIFRADASPRFHKDQRWGYFPALSVGWRISEENFLKNSQSLDDLKLRLSAGQAGDVGAVNFNYLSGYVLGQPYIFNANEFISTGIRSKGIPNPYARWAETTTYNAGLEGSFYNRLIYFEADAFYRKKEGMLATRVNAMPSTFGAPLPEENLNSQDTRGFDLMLGHSKRLGDFRYDVKGNVSWSRSKWIHFDEPEFADEEERTRRQLSGQWTNITWGYVADGLFSTQEEIDNWADITNGTNNNVIKPGDIRYVDQNEDDIINWKDQVVIGKNVVPEIFYGLSTNFTYKNIGLNILLQGATNYSVFYSDQYIAPFGVNFVPFAFWENRWTEENPDPSGSLPRVRYGASGTHPNGYNSTFWVIENAYYIRLKNVRLDYSLPEKWLERVGLQQVRLYADGFNLGALTNVRYKDPESNNTSGQYYPQQRTMSFGINLKF